MRVPGAAVPGAADAGRCGAERRGAPCQDAMSIVTSRTDECR